MLPLSVLKAAKGEAILIELKNGYTFNGRLDSVDLWMNVNLSNVICTSKVIPSSVEPVSCALATSNDTGWRSFLEH